MKSIRCVSLVIGLGGLILGGCSSFQNLKTERRSFQIRKAWVFQGPAQTNLRFRKINRMTPLSAKVSGREVVIAGNAIDGIVAYDLASGRIQWRYKIPFGVEASAQIFENNLYVGALDGRFYSLKVETGEVNWSFPTATENLAEPLATKDLVYFLSGGNSFHALDRGTGAQRWVYTRQDTNASSIRAGSKPAVLRDIIFAGFSDGAVVALNAATGAIKWERQLNRGVRFRDVDSDIVIDGEQLFAMGVDDAFYSLKVQTGEINWKLDLSGWGRPLVFGEKVYFASTTGEVHCIDKSSGKKIWNYKLESGVATSPRISQNLLIFGESQGSLVFLDAESGRKVGSFDPGRGILSSPGFDESEKHVLFVSGESNIYNLEFGWSWKPAFPHLK